MKALCAILFLIFIGATSPAGVDDVTMRKSSVDFLRSVIPDILTDPAIAAYFPDLHPDDVTLDESKVPGASGWIYRWAYRRGVHNIPNPNPEAQSVFVPFFEGKHSIVFELFVSFDHGDVMVGRIKNYDVLQSPKLSVGLYLQTGDDNAPLAKIDAIIKAHFARFRAAVGARDPLSK